MRKHKWISLLIAVCMLLTMTPAVGFADTTVEASNTELSQTYSDMAGHWSAQAVNKWSELGIVKGDDLGFRPNDPITRAELAVILDNLMDYQTTSVNTFNDVKKDAWYADVLLKANAAGILNGDGTGHAFPTAKVTREQAAVMLARAFGVDANTGNQTSFRDASNISAWAKPLVFGMEVDQYIGGMGNGNFEPKSNITRAQVVTMIDNAVQAYYTKAGTYTENVAPDASNANCLAIVKTSGVILKNSKISGDLIVAEGVGSGDFTLDATTISGKLIARGGGENSIHIINGAKVNGKVSVERVGGIVRIVSEGVVLEELDADTDVILEGEFTNVVVAEGASVEVRGKVNKLDVTAKSNLVVAKGATIGTLAVTKEAEGTNVAIDKMAEVNNIKTEANITTSGDGAAKAVTGSGKVTDKETGKAETATSSSGGSSGGGSGGSGGSGGNNSGATDKRSISFEEDDNYTTIIEGTSTWGEYFYLEGKDSLGNSCAALSMGALSIKVDGTLLGTSYYTSQLSNDMINISKSYINTLTEGKHLFDINITASDGKVFTLNHTIYIVPTAATILYNQPQYGTLQVNECTSETGPLGSSVVSGSSMSITDGNRLKIKLADLPTDKRIQSVILTESYYGLTETIDKTKYFIENSSTLYYQPKGTFTIQVVTEAIPASLPEISKVEFYLDYDYDTDTYSNPVTTTVPSMEPGDDAFLYAKVLLADGTSTKFANYCWQVAQSDGSYKDLAGCKYGHIWLYEAEAKDDISGHTLKLIVSGYDKQSQGGTTATIYIERSLQNPGQPTGLTGVNTSSATASDGKITGTIVEMEYKLQAAPSTSYVTCSAGETTGLAAGTYSVRYKSKTGYMEGYPVTITIAVPNLDQAAPTGLAGVAPATPTSDGKISGTTTAMEYKTLDAADSHYISCSEGETQAFTGKNTYCVRYKAKTGYNAGAVATIIIPAYSKQDQAAPTGLTITAASSSKSSNGKIIGTTTAMEYKLASTADSAYQDCWDTYTWVAGGIYVVRLKATTEKNASPTVEVTVTSPAAKNIATLDGLQVVYEDGSTVYESISGFSSSTTDYNVTLRGVQIGNDFSLSGNITPDSYATTSNSAITLNTGEYTTTLSIEVTSEDGTVKNTYTVNITVERRTIGVTCSPYTMAQGTCTSGQVLSLSLTNQDGESCTISELGGTVSIKLQNTSVLDSSNYTVDSANNTITILPDYLNSLPSGSTAYFNIWVETSDGLLLNHPFQYFMVTVN